MPCYRPRALTVAILALAAACAPDQGPSAPESPGAPPDLAGSAFRLTIDVASGRVEVAAPRPAASTAAAGPSFSLIGSDGVEFRGTGTNGSISCSWTSIPTNSKQKRCTFDFTLTNRLQFTDLVTPTSFPRPPQGTMGILVFPYTAAALGVPGGGATPSPDWDNAPANFFNDFGGCGGGKTSDCYRWERFTAPLYAGTTSEVHTVGFHVDKAAQSVSAYIVVAADLRDNPVQSATLTGRADLCGTWHQFDDQADPGNLIVGAQSDDEFRGLCGFSLAVLNGKSLVSATLDVKQRGVSGSPYDELGNVVVDHAEYDPFSVGDHIAVTSLQSNIGTLSTDPELEHKTLDVLTAVEDDLLNGRRTSQFALRFDQAHHISPVAFALFDGVGTADEPTLVIRYRNP
jgi:hypothetical protein